MIYSSVHSEYCSMFYFLFYFVYYILFKGCLFFRTIYYSIPWMGSCLETLGAIGILFVVSISMCMFVCMWFIYTYTYIHIHTHTYTHTYIHIYTRVCVYIHISVYIHTHECGSVCMCIYIYAYETLYCLCIHMCVCSFRQYITHTVFHFSTCFTVYICTNLSISQYKNTDIVRTRMYSRSKVRSSDSDRLLDWFSHLMLAECFVITDDGMPVNYQ